MIKNLPALLFAFTLLALRPSAATARLSLLGDVMLGRGVARAHASGDWETALEQIAPQLSRADLALANLESPLSNHPQMTKISLDSYDPSIDQAYNLCAPAEGVQALKRAGLDILALTNNHTNDCSHGGSRETRSILAAGGMGFIDQDMPIYRTVGSIPMVFYTFDDISAPLDLQTAAASILRSRKAGWLPVISIHWGSEYHPVPDPHQRQVAQAFADAGAALIWGHHPHVLQPIQWLAGAGQPQPTLVAYSLGNALFDQPSPPDVRRSALLNVTFNPQGVQTFEILPLQINFPDGATRPADAQPAAAIYRRLGLPVSSPLILSQAWSDRSYFVDAGRLK